MNHDNETNESERPAANDVQTLDDLIEILDQDALRNVVGGATARPKGQPHD